jgi:hypothetical protein
MLAMMRTRMMAALGAWSVPQIDLPPGDKATSRPGRKPFIFPA